MTKITFFLAFHNPFPGAAWTRIAYFAKYLKTKGHDVTVIGSCLRPHKPNSMWYEGVKILNICPISFQPMFLYIIDILLSFFLLPYFLVSKPDIIVISSPPFASCIGIHLIAKLIDTKIIIDVRDLDVYASSIKSVVYRTFKCMMANMYRNSDATITVTNFIEKNLCSRGVENVSIITNGADIETFKPIGNQKTMVREINNFDKSDFIIVYSGRLGYFYKLDLVIETMQKLVEHKKIKLLIVGEGIDKPRLKKLVHELGIQNKIKFIDATTDLKKLSQLLGMCDVGIHPANSPIVTVALSAKVFEYAACQLPTIVMMDRHGAWSKLISDWNAGIVVPSSDVEALERRIKYLFYSNKDREVMGKNARAMVEKLFSRKEKSEKLHQLVELITK